MISSESNSQSYQTSTNTHKQLKWIGIVKRQHSAVCSLQTVIAIRISVLNYIIHSKCTVDRVALFKFKQKQLFKKKFRKKKQKIAKNDALASQLNAQNYYINIVVDIFVSARVKANYIICHCCGRDKKSNFFVTAEISRIDVTLSLSQFM